jgi:hypothetical protein
VVVPTSFGQPPIVPRAINIGSPGMAVRNCFRQSLLARNRAGALHAEAVRCKLSVGREVKAEILVEAFY